MNNKGINVLLVSGNELLRRSLAFALQAFADLVYVGEAQTLDQGLRLELELKPDVIVAEYDLKGDKQMMHAFKEQFPAMKIILLSQFVNNEASWNGIDSDVTAVLTQNISIDELASAIRHAYHQK